MLRHRRGFICLVLLICLVSLAQVREKETPETRDRKVRDLLEKFNLAYQQRDVEGLAPLVVSDVTVIAANQTFTGWEDYRDKVLYATFSRPMPTSAWEVEKVVTTGEMAWAYTHTSYPIQREGEQVQADLWQVFILERRAETPPAASKPKDKTATVPEPDWRIVLIDYNFHGAGARRNQQQNQAPNSQGSDQPR